MYWTKPILFSIERTKPSYRIPFSQRFGQYSSTYRPTYVTLNIKTVFGNCAIQLENDESAIDIRCFL